MTKPKKRNRKKRKLSRTISTSQLPWEGFKEVALPLALNKIWHVAMANETYGLLIAYGIVTHWGVFDQLMICRIDGARERDWWVFQRIKDEVFGADREAIEIYPSARRVRDKAHSYHLFVLEEGAEIPLGRSDGFAASWPKGYPSPSSTAHLPPGWDQSR